MRSAFTRNPRTSSYRGCLVSALLVFCLLTGPVALAHAQITLDGSLGPSGPLSGPGYVIGQNLGQLRGTNLFHSFGQFNVRTGESATFTGPNFVTNVLSRVTGGQLSTIDGLISTRGTMPNANFFLLNPAGVIFGANARLDVGGSVRVSTADYLRFADGAVFFADLGRQSALSVADVAAFGFLRAPTAGITVNGSSLQVDPGQTLSLVGGGIEVSGGASAGNAGALVANSGRIEIASVASAGEVTLVNAAGAPDLGVTSFSRLGSITISDGALLDVSGAPGPSGSVVIRGGQLVVNQATILAMTTDAVSGAGLAVDVQIRGDAVLTNSGIVSLTMGSGDAGDIHVTAGNLHIDGAAISSNTIGSGRGADVVVDVGSLRLANGAAIAAGTFPSEFFLGGPGGTVTVTAKDSILIQDGSSIVSVTGALTPSGIGGDLTISAPSVTLAGGALIQSETFGDAAGGKIGLRTERLTMTGGSMIESRTQSAPGGAVIVTATESALLSDAGTGIVSGGSDVSTGAAPAGDIAVTSGRLTVTHDAVIRNGTFLTRAGNISVAATDSIQITDGGGILSLAFVEDVGSLTVSAPTLSIDRGFILASTTGTGRAGDIAINIRDLSLTNGGQIVTSSAEATGPGGTLSLNATGSVSISGRSSAPVFGVNPDSRSGLFSTASAAGPAGTINVSTPVLTMSDGGTITASSTGTAEALAGNINITFGDSLRLANSSITTSSNAADGGNIAITSTGSGSLVYLLDSQITTSVQSGVGSGGNITIGSGAHPVDAIVLNGSQIRADAFGGPGGKIGIFADTFLTSDSLVSASSALSTPGTIDIQARFTNLSGNIAQLPETVVQAAALLRAACAARLSAGKISSLVVAGREGVPLEPGGVMPSPLIAESLTDLGPSRSDGHEWMPLPGAWRVSLRSKCSM